MIDIKNYTINELAKMALKKPEDFGYWGSDDMFNTWGFAGIDRNRDSSILDNSNFEVICKDLISDYPDDFKIETYSHWLVGSVDRLTCRILYTPGDIIENNITSAFRSVMGWHSNLENYPVADDDDYYTKIDVECLNTIHNMEDYLLLVINTEEDGWAEKLYYTLTNDLNFEFNPDADQYPNDNKILEAALKANLCNPERWGEWNEWCDEQGFDRPIFPTKENPNQLKLFED